MSFSIKLSSTGLAVTGALSASGATTLSNITFGFGNLFSTGTNILYGPAAGAGALIRSAVSSTTNPTYSNVDDSDTGIFFPSANTVGVTVGGTNVTTTSSTGLAVTGALSATGDITGSANYYLGSAKFASRISGSNYIWAGSTELNIVDSTGATAWGQWRSTGLAVTGALSATGSALVNTASPAVSAAFNVGNTTPAQWSSHFLTNSATASLTGTGTGITLGWNYSAGASESNFVYGSASGGYLSIASSDGSTLTERMRLDASGNFLHGLSTYALNPSQGIALQAGSASSINIGHASGTPTNYVYSSFAYNAVQIGSISQSGTTAVAYNTTSDHRLKTNVRPANAAAFMAIEFVDFEWTDGRHDCGVIADQLQSVYPDLVLGAVDATEVRQIEITPAVPAVTEQVELTPAVDAIAEVVDADGVVTQEAVPAVAATYETVEVTPAIPAVTEDQTFPVYQQVNYMGLIGRMGTRVQQLQRTVDSQTSLIAAMEARLIALEAK